MATNVDRVFPSLSIFLAIFFLVLTVIRILRFRKRLNLAHYLYTALSRMTPSQIEQYEIKTAISQLDWVYIEDIEIRILIDTYNFLKLLLLGPRPDSGRFQS